MNKGGKIMYILLVKYNKTLEEIDKLIEGHIQYLEKYYRQSKFICSGRRIPRVGGVILANIDNELELKEIINEDPFVYHGAAEYEIIEFTPTKWDANFSHYVKK